MEAPVVWLGGDLEQQRERLAKSRFMPAGELSRRLADNFRCHNHAIALILHPPALSRER